MPGRSECCNFGTSFEAKNWLSLDPCGFVCVGCSLGIHIYATTVIAVFLIAGSPVVQWAFAILYLPLTSIAIISLFKAWLTNPGAVPMGARPLTALKRSGSTELVRSIRRCHKCNDNFKPPRAHHDSVTGRCIVKFDHYCPWVGNAVGAMNHKFFCLFIGYTSATCLMSICIMIFRLVTCNTTEYEIDHLLEGAKNHQQESWREPNNKKADPHRSLNDVGNCNSLFGNYFVIALIILSIIFFIFTCCMFWEQIEAIRSNRSKIARMKLSVGEGGTELERVSHDFNEMFGGNTPRVSWHWFLPLDVKFPEGMIKVVLGYEWDPTFGEKPYQENDLVAALSSKAEINPECRDIDVQEVFSEESESLALSENLNASIHSLGTKKRSGSKKKLLQRAEFVDRTHDRLT
jgi:palmitoyltransferase ZDHHC3/7/25